MPTAQLSGPAGYLPGDRLNRSGDAIHELLHGRDGGWTIPVRSDQDLRVDAGRNHQAILSDRSEGGDGGGVVRVRGIQERDEDARIEDG